MEEAHERRRTSRGMRCPRIQATMPSKRADSSAEAPTARFTRPDGIWTDPPAWRMATAFARRAPSFLVIGAQRAGTTSLYELLARHPNVRPALRKEGHYFDFQYAESRRWYLAHFPPRSAPGLTGEASPYYMVHPLAPGRVSEMNPRMKLIAILRDPVDRALSHYHLEVRHGVESLTFEQAIEAEGERLAADRHGLRQAPYFFSYNHHHYAYLDRSRYGHYLGQWRRRFPREQLHVIRAEAMFEDPHRVIDETLAFLELPPSQRMRDEVPHANKAPPNPPMDPALRARLDLHFQADRAAFDELLGR